jgi:hypothetical protein
MEVFLAEQISNEAAAGKQVIPASAFLPLVNCVHRALAFQGHFGIAVTDYSNIAQLW